MYLDRERNIPKDWMLGKITAEQVHKILSDESGADYDVLWETFKKECEAIDLSSPILNKIKDLKDKYITILSTGNMDSFDRFTVKNNPILTNSFDRIDNSFNLGVFKTSNGGQYFLDVAKEFGVNIQECFVLDDSEKVCKTFEGIGGTAYRVTGENEVLDALDKII